LAGAAFGVPDRPKSQPAMEITAVNPSARPTVASELMCRDPMCSTTFRDINTRLDCSRLGLAVADTVGDIGRSAT
jgi:hypothetical protein